MDSAISRQLLRDDALQLALGIVVLASGLAACLLFVPRAKRRDFTLL
jgi:hypothetical protein